MPTPTKDYGKDSKLLNEINSRFDYCLEQWAEIRAEARKDMAYVSGDPWEPTDRQQRRDAGRPCVSYDEYNQYANQILNDVRANPRAVKFTANGDGATDQTAEFYSNKMREIEYRSRGSMVYITALENALYRSYGFARVRTKFISPKSRNQDLWLEAFPNPDMVLPDPDALSPTSSDMKFCFAFETWKTDEFERKWPKATVKNLNTVIQLAPKFLTEDTVIVAEYWKIENDEKELIGVRLPDGNEIEGFEEELVKTGQLLPGSVELWREKRDVPRVVQYFTNGVEILKTTPWPGKYIPIVSTYGKVLWINEGGTAKRKILSLTRLMRDALMANAWAQTGALELAAAITKNPYWAYRGQLDATETQAIAKSLHEPVAVLTAGAMTEATGQQILPLPQRNSLDPDLQGWILLIENTRRAIQAAAGNVFLPTQAQKPNDKSGVALDHIDKSAQRGSFHFVDHYLDMIQQVGIMVEDLLDKTIDTARDVSVRTVDDLAATVRVNDPNAPDGLPSIKGDHLVTVSTGPSYDSEREKVNDFSNTLLQNPEVLQIVGPEKAQRLLAQTIRLMDLGAKGDEIANVIDPPIGKDGQPSPEQMQQKLQQLMQAGQQMQQALEGAKQIIDTEQVKQQATLEQARLDREAQATEAQLARDTQIELQRMKDATEIRKAEIAAETKGIVTGHADAHEADALARQQVHEADEAERDRLHELSVAALTQGHEDRVMDTNAMLAPPEAAV